MAPIGRSNSSSGDPGGVPGGPTGSDLVTVTAKSWYDIEEGYDFLYGEYSLDGGESWQRVGNPVTGSSKGKWTTLRYAYRADGAPSLFRFRYQTDGGVHLPGAFLDDIAVNSFSDDASWNNWQGYLLGPLGLGGRDGAWAFANLGVLFALLIGLVGGYLLRRTTVARQEA